MAEICSISFCPSHIQKWIVRGNFRGIGEIPINLDMPEDFAAAVIQLAQAALDKKEAEIRCSFLSTAKSEVG